MRYRLSRLALIATATLLWTGCSVSRQATSATTETRATTNFTNVTNERDSVVIAERDTLKEVTVITIDRNEAGDTVRVSSVTDRTRLRDRSQVRDKSEKLIVKTDTVYIEKRDSVEVKSEKGKVMGHRHSSLR